MVNRRGKAESGDIDALVTHPSLTTSSDAKKKHSEQLKSLVDALKGHGIVTDTISVGDTKFMVNL